MILSVLTRRRATGNENKYPDTIDRKIDPGIAKVFKEKNAYDKQS